MLGDIYINKLKRWFSKFERYKVGYKDGFFHLSNLANSPYTIVESFDKMPFCKHDRELKLLTADTIFVNAKLYHAQPEDGVWVFVSDMYYKKNITVTNIYDKTLPMDYHFINIHYKSQVAQSKSMLVNGILVKDKTWSVFKNGHALTLYHFKNAYEKNITIYFTKDWLKNNGSQYFENGKLLQFFDSENNYILLNDNNVESDSFYDAFLDLVADKNNVASNEVILNHIYGLFNYYHKQLDMEAFTEEHFKLSDSERRNIQKAEKILIDALFIEFPGIEPIAKLVGISPTKLKADFKTIHTKTLYDYYSHQQMKVAHQLISDKAGTIKDIALSLGYQNAGKFSARFKETYGCTPTELTN